MINNKSVMEDKPSRSTRIRKRRRRRNEEFVTSNSIPPVDATISFLSSPTTIVPTTPHDELFPSQSNEQQKPHTPLMIGYGCLLIPAVFLIWWYWTKRTARRVVSKVITFSHRGSSSPSDDVSTTICNCEHDDNPTSPYYSSYTSTSPQSEPYHYKSWDDDVMPEGSSSNKNNAFRFFHWMKRNGTNSKTSRTRPKVYNPHEYKSPNEMELSSPNARTTNQLPINTLQTTQIVVVQGLVPETTNIDHFPIEMYVMEYPQISPLHSFNTETIV
jgi:hypothetical protein